MDEIDNIEAFLNADEDVTIKPSKSADCEKTAKDLEDEFLTFLDTPGPTKISVDNNSSYSDNHNVGTSSFDDNQDFLSWLEDSPSKNVTFVERKSVETEGLSGFSADEGIIKSEDLPESQQQSMDTFFDEVFGGDGIVGTSSPSSKTFNFNPRFTSEGYEDQIKDVIQSSFPDVQQLRKIVNEAGYINPDYRCHIWCLLLTESCVEDEEARFYHPEGIYFEGQQRLLSDCNTLITTDDVIGHEISSGGISSKEVVNAVRKDAHDILILYCQRRNIHYSSILCQLLAPLLAVSVRIPRALASSCFYAMATNFIPLIGLHPMAYSLAEGVVHRWLRTVLSYHSPALVQHLDRVLPHWEEAAQELSAQQAKQLASIQKHNTDLDELERELGLDIIDEEEESAAAAIAGATNTRIGGSSNVSTINTTTSVIESAPPERNQTQQKQHTSSGTTASNNNSNNGHMKSASSPLAAASSGATAATGHSGSIPTHWITGIFTGSLPPSQSAMLLDWAIFNNCRYAGLYFSVALLEIYSQSLLKMSGARIQQWFEEVATNKQDWYRTLSVSVPTEVSQATGSSHAKFVPDNWPAFTRGWIHITAALISSTPQSLKDSLLQTEEWALLKAETITLTQSLTGNTTTTIANKNSGNITTSISTAASSSSTAKAAVTASHGDVNNNNKATTATTTTTTTKKTPISTSSSSTASSSLTDLDSHQHGGATVPDPGFDFSHTQAECVDDNSSSSEEEDCDAFEDTDSEDYGGDNSDHHGGQEQYYTDEDIFNSTDIAPSKRTNNSGNHTNTTTTKVNFMEQFRKLSQHFQQSNNSNNKRAHAAVVAALSPKLERLRKFAQDRSIQNSTICLTASAEEVVPCICSNRRRPVSPVDLVQTFYCTAFQQSTITTTDSLHHVKHTTSNSICFELSTTEECRPFYFGIDCRSASEKALGQFPKAYSAFDFADGDDGSSSGSGGLTDGEEMMKLLDMVETMASSVHICLIGAGEDYLHWLYDQQQKQQNKHHYKGNGSRYRRSSSSGSSRSRRNSNEEQLPPELARSLEDHLSRLNAVAMFFLKRSFKHISILDGGFVAAARYLQRSDSYLSLTAALVDCEDRTALESLLGISSVNSSSGNTHAITTSSVSTAAAAVAGGILGGLTQHYHHHTTNTNNNQQSSSSNNSNSSSSSGYQISSSIVSRFMEHTSLGGGSSSSNSNNATKDKNNNDTSSASANGVNNTSNNTNTSVATGAAEAATNSTNTANNNATAATAAATGIQLLSSWGKKISMFSSTSLETIKKNVAAVAVNNSSIATTTNNDAATTTATSANNNHTKASKSAANNSFVIDDIASATGFDEEDDGMGPRHAATTAAMIPDTTSISISRTEKEREQALALHKMAGLRKGDKVRISRQDLPGAILFPSIKYKEIWVDPVVATATLPAAVVVTTEVTSTSVTTTDDCTDNTSNSKDSNSTLGSTLSPSAAAAAAANTADTSNNNNMTLETAATSPFSTSASSATLSPINLTSMVSQQLVAAAAAAAGGGGDGSINNNTPPPMKVKQQTQVHRYLAVSRERFLVLDSDGAGVGSMATVKSNRHLTEMLKMTFKKKDPELVTLYFVANSINDSDGTLPASGSKARQYRVSKRQEFVNALQKNMERFK